MSLINFIPDTMIDDYFFFGFLGGTIGYLWYWFTNHTDPKNHIHAIAGIYGTLLSGLLGGLLAIVFDKAIEVSIVVGLLNQLIYMALMKSARSNDMWGVIKEVLVRYLTGGQTKL